MGTYLYCIGAPGHPEPGDVRGVAEAPVEALEVAGFVVWVSAMGSAPTASLEGAREHNDVVERACANRTALPVRFGQWFARAEDLEAELRERREALGARLDMVDGAVEMGIRVLDPTESHDPPDRSTGRAYLEGIAKRDARTRAARDRGADIASELDEWLTPVARALRAKPLGTSAGLVAVSVLVARHDIGDYNARVRGFAPRYPELRFLFSGPWPPYGFADDGQENAV